MTIITKYFKDPKWFSVSYMMMIASKPEIREQLVQFTSSMSNPTQRNDSTIRTKILQL